MRTLFITLLIILTSIIIHPLTVLATATATSQIDKTQTELNNYVVLTIKIDEASSIEPPILMGMDNFQQMSASSSNNTTIINGRISNSVVFQYILIPKKVGTFNIGEAYITTNSGRLHTKPELITVTDSTNNQTQINQSQPNNYNKQNIDVNSDVELRAEVNNNNPYKNEQIIYTIRLFFRGTLSDIQLNTPQFQDFIAEPLDERQQYTTYVQGNLYNVLEKAYALFPTKSGKLTIQPSSIICNLMNSYDPLDQIFGNYSSKPVSLKTKPINLIVKEPPKAPKTYKDSVGEFKIKTEINNTILDIGETAKLQISIWGKGNITNIQEPSFNFNEQFKKGFKIYDMTPITQITDKSEFITGQKVFKYDIVALEPGIYHIPLAEYAYFNPETKMYHQLRSSIIEIRVKSGKGIDINNNQSQASNSSIDEVISIYTDEKCLTNNYISKKQYLLYLVMLAIPLLMLLFTFALIKLKAKREANSHIIKKKQAFRNANNKLKKLKHFVKNDNSKEFFSQLDNIIKDYIGHKLYLPSGSLTSKDVEMHLLNKNVSKKTVIFITEILKLCEMSEYYTGQKAHQKIAIAFKDAKKVLQLLEKELKK